MKPGYILDGPPKTVNSIIKRAHKIAELYASLQQNWRELSEIIGLENDDEHPSFESWVDEWWNTHKTHADDLLRWIAERSDTQSKRKKLAELKLQIVPLMRDLDIDVITADEED